MATHLRAQEQAAGPVRSNRLRGWTQQRIADRFKKPQSTVSKFIACARDYSLVNNRPDFWDAFREVNSAGGPTTGELIVASNENNWYTPARYVEAARWAELRNRHPGADLTIDEAAGSGRPADEPGWPAGLAGPEPTARGSPGARMRPGAS